MAQGDVYFMVKTIESLVVEFDQKKYEEFLSSGSKSPRVVRQYCRVSSEIRSQVPSETSSKMACANNAISRRVARVVRVTVSHKTREANVVEGQSGHAPPLPQLQVIRDPQQPMKHNRNIEHQQRRRAR